MELILSRKGEQFKMLYDARDEEIIEELKPIFVSKHGYATTNSATYPTSKVHRILMNYFGDMEVDHINRNKLDNRRSNLRIVNRSQNLFNHEFDPKKYRWVNTLMRDGVQVGFAVKIQGFPMKNFNNLHDAIRYVYPLVQQVQGEFCSDKRTLEEVLRDVENITFNTLIIRDGEGLECPNCKKTIQGNQYYTHVWNCYCEHGCYICGKMFADVGKCKRHKEENCIGQKRVPCTKCGKEFSSKDNAKRHEKTCKETKKN